MLFFFLLCFLFEHIPTHTLVAGSTASLERFPNPCSGVSPPWLEFFHVAVSNAAVL